MKIHRTITNNPKTKAVEEPKPKKKFSIVATLKKIFGVKDES